jgi:hypothetical protein
MVAARLGCKHFEEGAKVPAAEDSDADSRAGRTSGEGVSSN